MEAGPCVDQEEAAGKRFAWSPQPILGGNLVLMVQAQRDSMEQGALQRETEKKKQKGKKYREKKKYILTPRPCPNQGVLGPA